MALASTDDYEALIDDQEPSSGEETDPETMMTEMVTGSQPTFTTTSFGTFDGAAVITKLSEQAIHHAFQAAARPGTSTLVVKDVVTYIASRYGNGIFMGILIDTEASERSTAGEHQLIALQRIQHIEFDKTRAGEARIQFGIGQAVSIGTAEVTTPIGTVIFHVVQANTPFLLCLRDMDLLRATFNNLRNVMVQGSNMMPIVRAGGHPWMLLDPIKALTFAEGLYVTCHLTRAEMEQVHRRFGHPSPRRLYRMLQRAGHTIPLNAIEQITKFCKNCQLHKGPPQRFNFTLKDDTEFNHTIYLDVLKLDDRQVLQVVDEATKFQSARFLKSMSAQHAWDAVRACWMDYYLGPPVFAVHDPGTNFHSKEFCENVRAVGTENITMPVEAHNSVGIVERYHIPLRRVYNILLIELPDITREERLQMAIKSVNDTAGPDGLVPTLLVFGAYPRIGPGEGPAASITKRAEANKKAMAEVRKCQAARKVADALRMRNGPNTVHLANLPLNSEVLVWREGKGWQGPFSLLRMDRETCQLDLPHGPTNFRSTSVRPFYREGALELERGLYGESEETTALRRSQRPTTQNAGGVLPIVNPPRSTMRIEIPSYIPDPEEQISVFITEKEKRDKDLALEYRRTGVINTTGEPFEESRRKEASGLLKQGVFKVISAYDSRIKGQRIFGSRMVDGIKREGTAAPYEKSRLVIQAYNYAGKEHILTQSPTLQRAAQKLIASLAPSLSPEKARLFVRDIVQAYIQSGIKLKRTIFVRPPPSLAGSVREGRPARIYPTIVRTTRIRRILERQARRTPCQCP